MEKISLNEGFTPVIGWDKKNIFGPEHNSQSFRNRLIHALVHSPTNNVLDFIRANLDYHGKLNGDRYRFDMSHNAPINNKILQIFEPLGIQNTRGAFLLTFWKGCPELFYFDKFDGLDEVESTHPGDLNGAKTVWLICRIFENTIFKHSLNKFIDDYDITPDLYKGWEFLNWASFDEEVKYLKERPYRFDIDKLVQQEINK